jgi:hypothetical protein
MIAIGTLGLAAVATVAFLRTRDRVENHPTAPVPSAETPPPAATSAEPTVTPVLIPSAAPEEVVSAPTAAPTRSPGPAKAKPCKIKSYLDESGIKHFVKECK